MSTGLGHLDLREFKQLKEQLAKLDKSKAERFCYSTTRDLTQMLLAGATNRTPVGVYPAGSGRMGGTLRRNWHATKVEKTDNGYTADVFNDTEYAMYVEYGHRTRPTKNGSRGWVYGRFMLTNAKNDMENGQIEALVRNKLKRMLP